MDIRSGSITPPCSPLVGRPCDVEDDVDLVKEPYLELCEEAPIVCFVCDGAPQDGATHRNKHLHQGAPLHGNTHRNSFLHQGAMQKLKNGAVVYQVNVTEDIFGENFLLQSGLLEGLGRLFYLAKKLICRVERLSETPAQFVHSETLDECLTARKEIMRFFNYLKTYIYRCITPGVASKAIPWLLNHLRSLLLHIRRLADLPAHVIGAAASWKQSCGLHVFHMHLDLHWSILELLHIITDQFQDEVRDSSSVWCRHKDAVTDTDVFSQCVHMMLWDVITLAMRTHSLMTPQQYWHVSPFPCDCVREMLTMLIQLLSHRQETTGGQSFWVQLSPLLTSLFHQDENSIEIATDDGKTDSDVFSLPPIHACRDPVDFSWWFLTSVAPLYMYDECGVYQSNLSQPVTSNYILLEQLLKKSLLLRESQLRRHLRCCLRISELWEGSAIILNILWDHFYKCLNDQFLVPGSGVAGVACVSKTASGVLETCQNLTEDHSYGTDNDTSFQLFLRLLAMHLGKRVSGSSSLWKQMKGRFYSKFHRRRMQELSEVGLNNVTSLFLSLTYVISLQDVGSKLFELYHMLDLTVIDTHRHRAIWRGSFALVLRFLRLETDVGFIADKMVHDFNGVCVDLRQSGEGSSPNYGLVMFYVESLQDVMEESSLHLHQCQLLGSGISDLLHCCRVSELSSLLNLAQILVTRHRVVYKRAALGKTVQVDNTSVLSYCRDLASALWLHFYKFVRVHSCTLTPPPLLADLAAGFTLLLLHSPPGEETENLKDCFLYFGCSEQVNAMVSCRYLCHMIPNADLMSRLAATLTNYESRLIQAWVQCNCLLPSDSPMLQELTRLVLKLPSMQNIFSTADLDPSDSSETVVCQFIRSLGVVYSQLTELRTKLDMRRDVESYLQDVPSCITAVLKTTSLSLHTNICLIAGSLTRHCAAILYIKSKPDCLLPILLDRLVLPRILLTPSKPVPPHILSALQETLYLFVQGLGQLDHRRDPYIQRKLNDIVRLYLPRFPLLSICDQGATSVHPLLRSLSDSCRLVPTDDVGLRGCVLQCLVTDCLTPQGMIPQHNAHLALNFIVELFNKTINRAELARYCAALLPAVLHNMLCCDNSSLKQSCVRVMQVMLEAVRDHQETTDRAGVREALLGLLGHIKTCPTKVLRVMESVSVLCPRVVIDVIPAMTRAVKMSESTRGVGVDKELRLAYHAVLTNLGSNGNEEWSRLLLES